jgi:hypothetical protein
LQQYSGIAPFTERSGKKSWVHWRWQCPTFMRQTFVEWAGQTINKSCWAGACYRQQRAKGSSYQAALRSVAFDCIRILYHCWQTHTPYLRIAMRPFDALGMSGQYPYVTCPMDYFLLQTIDTRRSRLLKALIYEHPFEQGGDCV